MFKRSFTSSQGVKDHSSKVSKQQKQQSKRSFPEKSKKKKMLETLESPPPVRSHDHSSLRTSAIANLAIGPEKRLFAAHEDILHQSPFFHAVLQCQSLDTSSGGHVVLPDEEPEAFSCVLEYLYKGDYTPRLLHSKRRGGWSLERIDDPPSAQATLDSGKPAGTKLQPAVRNDMATMFHSGDGTMLLRDTVVYCAAERYGLDGLKKLALQKQGLQIGVDVSTVLRSARYAYTHTPDTDSRLRAHYLSLIIRARRAFKHSGTMQQEMVQGGPMFFDLFVAMCNHIDDINGTNNASK